MEYLLYLYTGYLLFILGFLGLLQNHSFKNFHKKRNIFLFLPCNFLLNFSSLLLLCVRDAALGLP